MTRGLRDDRERRQAGRAAPRQERRGAAERGRAARRPAAVHAEAAARPRHRPERAAGRPAARSTTRRTRRYGTSQAVFGSFPVADRRQDGHGREVRRAPRLPGRARPVLVVRLRALRGARDRRLRPDRERRPRRHGRGADGAEGLREVLQRRADGTYAAVVQQSATRWPRPASSSRPARRPPPGSSARSSATSTTCCSLATGGLVAYGLWVLGVGDPERHRRRPRLLRLPAGDLRRRRRRRCWRSPLPSTRTSTAVSAGRSTPSRSCCSSPCSSSPPRCAARSAGSRSASSTSSRPSSGRSCSSSCSRASSPSAGTASGGVGDDARRHRDRAADDDRSSSRSPTSGRR